MTNPTRSQMFASLVLRKSGDRIIWATARDKAAKLTDIKALKASGGKESLGEEFDELNALGAAAESWKSAHKGTSLAQKDLAVIEAQADKVKLIIQGYRMECDKQAKHFESEIARLRIDVPKLTGDARDKGTAALKYARAAETAWSQLDTSLGSLESRPASIVATARHLK